MGGQWDNLKTITFSIAPDGVNWDKGTNNVNASLNSQFNGTGWQTLVAEALQTWSAATNLNFAQVGDGPYDFNAPGPSQGDPSLGDIRIGGYNFGTTGTIAQTYGPPPNGQTGAGDVELNTGFSFAPGTHYDLETIVLHELGHSLGLGESPQPLSVMYTYYSGVRQALSTFDIEGIQSLYGARASDAYQSYGVASSTANPLNLNPILNAASWGQLGGLSLSSIGDAEYFSVVAPQTTGSTLSVAAIAQGSSLLSPKVSLIDPSTGATLASNGHANQYGDVAVSSTSGVQAGHRYLIAVTGATNDVFSIGSYGLQLGFFGGTSTNPPIQPDSLPYNQPFALATELGPNSQATIPNLTLPSALNYQLFTFEVSQPGYVVVGSAGANFVLTDSAGHDLLGGSGLKGFQSARAGARYYLILLSPNGLPVSNYGLAVRSPG